MTTILNLMLPVVYVIIAVSFGVKIGLMYLREDATDLNDWPDWLMAVVIAMACALLLPVAIVGYGFYLLLRRELEDEKEKANER